MFRQQFKAHGCFFVATALIALFSLPCRQGFAQAQADLPAPSSNPVHFKVDESSERLEMIVRASRILTLDFRVPKMLANNPEIIRVTPLSPNQIQVSALKAGVTQLNLWDEKDNITSIDIIVYGDARELDNMLKLTFPEASIRVQPLSSSVVLSGYVPDFDMISRVVRTAEDYYPKVINNLEVGGAQQILLHVKVIEVSRTKLRSFGFDWAHLNSNGSHVAQSASGLLTGFTAAQMTATGAQGATVKFGIVDGSSSFFGFLESLRTYGLAKVLAEPTLATISGRPANFNAGGEFPILVPQSLGTVSIQYKQYGTRVDFVPIVLGKGDIRLEVRPTVTEIDGSTAVTVNNISVPGLRTRWVDTAVEMKAGQTFALAGLLQTRTESENTGLPVLADLPWFGAAFRRVREMANEVELLITVTPEFTGAMDPHEVPACGPGQLTTSPNNVELFGRGYMEVPKRCDDRNCPPGQGGQDFYGPNPGFANQQNQMSVPRTSVAQRPAQGVPNPNGSYAPAGSYNTQQFQAQPAIGTYRGSAVSGYQNPAPVEYQNRRNTPAMNGGQSQYAPTSAQRPNIGAPRNPEPGLIGPQGYDVIK